MSLSSSFFFLFFSFVVAVSATIILSSANPHLSPDQIISQYNFSGSVSLFQPGTPLWRKNFGFLDTRFRIPFDENQDPSYPMASNTKLYTAISLYQLQERNLVILSASISNYIGPQDMIDLGQNPSNQKFCLSLNPSAPNPVC